MSIGGILRVYCGRYADSPVAANTTPTRFPATLLYPVDHFPVANPAAQALFDAFAAFLAARLNITTVPINITAAFRPLLPAGNFTEFQLSSNRLAEYWSWARVGRPLTEYWRTQHIRGAPAFDPNPRSAFARAQALTDDDYAAAVAQRREFSAAVAQRVLRPDDAACTGALLLYDGGTGGRPSYRMDELNALADAVPLVLPFSHAGAPGARLVDNLNYLASAAGAPDVTIPLGQVEFHSAVSRAREVLPVAAQLVARRGCEGVLVRLVGVLAEMGVLRETKVGRSAFDGAAGW